MSPQSCEKARRAVELARFLHLPGVPGGRLTLDGNMLPGKGLGSSTTDVIAAVRAFSDCHGHRLRPAEIARIAVLAEGASDSTMIEDGVSLFAQREGRVLEILGVRLPRMVVVGCDTDPTGRGVDTMAFEPARYDADEVETFRALRGLTRRAVTARDCELLARVADASARLNQRYLPTTGFDELCGVAERSAALGIQVAHSGTVAGLLFCAGCPETRGRIERARELLRDAGFTTSWVFEVK